MATKIELELCDVCGPTVIEDSRGLAQSGVNICHTDLPDGHNDILRRAYKQLKKCLYRLKARGVLFDEACKNSTCACVILHTYRLWRLALAIDVEKLEYVCICCKLKHNVSAENIIRIAEQQFVDIDMRALSPLTSRLTRKVNVCVNTLRQLAPFITRVCDCEKHTTEDRCACGYYARKCFYELARDHKVLALSGVEETSTTRDTNVTLIDQREIIHDEGFVIGQSITPSHIGISMSENTWSLMNIMKRPTPIVQIAWNKDVTDKIGQLALPGDLIHGAFKNVLGMFNFLRGSLVLRFQVNGTKFHVGQLICYVVPTPRLQIEVGVFPLDVATSMPHVKLDASMNNSGEIKIPFSHMLSYFNTNVKDNGQRLGQLIMRPFNPLRASAGATNKLNVSVWAHFEDLELHQPYVHVVTMPTGGLPTGTAGVGQVFRNVAGVANGIASAISLVGNLDKPTDGNTYQRYVPTAITDVAHGVGMDRSIRMGLLPKGVSDASSTMMSATDSDMNVLTMAKLKTRLATIEWTKDKNVGQVLFSMPAYPSLYGKAGAGTGYNLYQVPMLSYCARGFCYYRGSLCVTLDIASAVMQTGRLLVAYVAGKHEGTPALADVMNGGMLCCDIAEQKIFSANIPYMSTKPWMRCDKFVSYESQGDLDLCNGMIYVFVLNNLACPDGTPTSAFVNIMVSAGSDFELAVPSDFTGFLSNNVKPPLEQVFGTSEVVVEEEAEVVKPVVVKPVAPKPKVDSNALARRAGSARNQAGLLPGFDALGDKPKARARDNLPIHDGGEAMEREVVEAELPDVGRHPLNIRGELYTPNPIRELQHRRFESGRDVFPQDSRFHSYFIDVDTGDVWAMNVAQYGEQWQNSTFFFKEELPMIAPRNIHQLRRNVAGDRTVLANFEPESFYLFRPGANWWNMKVRDVNGIIVNHPVAMEFDGFDDQIRYAKGQQRVFEMSELRALLAENVPVGSAGVVHVADGRKDEASADLAYGNVTAVQVASMTTSENAMDMKTNLRRKYPVCKMDLLIANTDTSNIPYICFPVTPMLARSNRVLKQQQYVRDAATGKTVKEEVVIGAESYSHLTHFGGAYTFWRGALRFAFMFGQAENSDIVIQIVYRPNVASNTNYGEVKYLKTENYIASLEYATVLYQGRVQASIEVETPFTSTYNQLLTFNAITSGIHDLRSSAGTLQVYFLGTKQVISQAITLFVGLGDDAVFSYLRGPPTLYIRTGVEGKRDLSDAAIVQDFSLGTPVFPTGVPVGSMGLRNFFKNAGNVAQNLNDMMPEISSSLVSFKALSDYLTKLAKGVNGAIDVLTVVSDVIALSNSCILLTMTSGWERVMHVAHIIIIVALRIGVKLVVSTVANFVMSIFEEVKGWWPKVRNTPVGASGFDVSPFVPLCAALIGLVCKQTLPTSGLTDLCKSVLPCFRLINEGTRAAQNVLSWISPFVDVLKMHASRAILGIFPGLANWLRITDKIEDIVEWMNDIDCIDPESMPRLAAESREFRMKIYHLRDKAMEYTSHIAKGEDRHIVGLVREYARKIVMMANEMTVMMDTPSSRVDPFSICLVGDSGVGKSALIPVLMHPLLDQLGYPRYNRIYARNSSDQYWSRYKGEVVTVMDDYDQGEDSPAILELVDIKTNNIYQLNHGTVEKKGLLFLSEFVVLTTNTAYPTRNYVTCRKAWWRRRNVLIKVVRNALPFDAENYSHLWFRFLDPAPENTATAVEGPMMSLEELRMELADRAKAYLKTQYMLVKRNEALANGDYALAGIVGHRTDDTREGVIAYDSCEECRALNLEFHGVETLRKIAPEARAGKTLFLDIDRLKQAAFFHLYEEEMFEHVVCVRDQETQSYNWHCTSEDPFFQEEWDHFRFAHHDLTRVLRPYIRMSLPSRITEWRDYFLNFTSMIWEKIKKHPILVASAVAGVVLLGVWKYMQISPSVHAMSSVYQVNAQKVSRGKVLAASGEIDKISNDLVEKRVLPYIYRIGINCGDGVQYVQNCFAIGKRWVVTARHLFAEQLRKRASQLEFFVKYGNCWMDFVVEKDSFVVQDKYDLIFLKLDARFHEHRSNLDHFVDEKDLSKISEFSGVYVGGFLDGSVKVVDVEGKPLRQQMYLDPFNGEPITIYKAWKYNKITEKSTCGGVLVLNNSKIRGKIVGIHVAGDAEFGYAHVVTKQIVAKFITKEITCAGIVLPQVSKPLPSSFPMGHFGEIGVIAGKTVGAVNKTELVPSVIQGAIGPVETAPSVLSSKDPRLEFACSPMYKAIMKLGTASAGFNQSFINYVAAAVANRYMVLDQKYARILSDKEALVGLEGLEHVDRINMSTSAGYPYVTFHESQKGKLWLLNETGDAVQHAELVRRVQEREVSAKRGDRVESVWIDCLKDEKRPLEKVKQGNTRLFQIPPFDFTLIFRKYFLGFVAACMEKRHVLASQVGINPYGPDWTHLYERLTEFSCYFYCGDYKNFDKSTLPQFMEAYASAANKFYGDEEGSSAANVRHTLVEELIHTVHLTVDKSYASHHGNPSGNPGTTHLNGFINEDYMGCAWMLVHLEKKLSTTMEEYFENVLNIVFGDDNILAVKREKTDIFNPDSIAYVLKKYLGVDYTSGTKDGTGGKFVGIEDVVFLKNKFKDREGDPFRKWAALDVNTIREMCNWVKGSNFCTEATLENVNNSCRFAYFHGRKFYSEWVKLVSDALKDKGVTWFAPTFESYDLWFLSQFDDE